MQRLKTTGDGIDLAENQCPRCLGMIPNNERPGEYPGALSRYDNQTEVCSRCGEDEAMGIGPLPVYLWPIETNSTPEEEIAKHKTFTITYIR